MTKADGNTLAFQRTLFASERTLMAWVRTAVSLLGFGFSIPHFFSVLKATETIQQVGDVGPKALGIALTLIGVLGLWGGIWEHFHLLKSIKSITGIKRAKVLFSPVLTMALGISFLGIAVLGLLIVKGS